MSKARLIAALTLAAALCGCSDVGQAEPAEFPPLDVQQIAKETSEFQRQVLADSAVSRAEYDRATQALIECLRKEGLDVSGPFPREGDDRFLDFTFSKESAAGTDPDAADKEIVRAHDKCDAAYRRDVDRVWTYQNVTDPREREELRTKVIACLREIGITLDKDASASDIYQSMVDHRENAGVPRCRSQYSGFFLVGVK